MVSYDAQKKCMIIIIMILNIMIMLIIRNIIIVLIRIVMILGQYSDNKIIISHHEVLFLSH